MLQQLEGLNPPIYQCDCCERGDRLEQGVITTTTSPSCLLNPLPRLGSGVFQDGGGGADGDKGKKISSCCLP